jgi:hypothetical protein
MYAIIINGKIQTEKLDEFVEGFNKLLDDTNCEFFGKIDKYHFIEYVDYQKVDAVTVEPDVEVQNN